MMTENTGFLQSRSS